MSGDLQGSSTICRNGENVSLKKRLSECRQEIVQDSASTRQHRPQMCLATMRGLSLQVFFFSCRVDFIWLNYFLLKRLRIRLMILNPVITPLKIAIPELKLLTSILVPPEFSTGWNNCRADSEIRCLDALISVSFSAFCWQIISRVIGLLVVLSGVVIFYLSFKSKLTRKLVSGCIMSRLRNP